MNAHYSRCHVYLPHLDEVEATGVQPGVQGEYFTQNSEEK